VCQKLKQKLKKSLFNRLSEISLQILDNQGLLAIHRLLFRRKTKAFCYLYLFTNVEEIHYDYDLKSEEFEN